MLFCPGGTVGAALWPLGGSGWGECPRPSRCLKWFQKALEGRVSILPTHKLLHSDTCAQTILVLPKGRMAERARRPGDRKGQRIATQDCLHFKVVRGWVLDVGKQNQWSSHIIKSRCRFCLPSHLVNHNQVPAFDLWKAGTVVTWWILLNEGYRLNADGIPARTPVFSMETGAAQPPRLNTMQTGAASCHFSQLVYHTL